MTSRDSGKEALRQIIEGLEFVAYGGPWEVGDLEQRKPYSPHFEVMNETDIFAHVYCGLEAPSSVRSVAEHIARCHPDAMRAIAEYVAALEAERDELKAGIKRLSDEEELINETGRDGMLSAVHIGARLAEAEELARAMEAEANQMREVSISHRNRAEALEESLKTVLASLVATTSLIIRAEDLKVKPSKAVASDKMFTQMLKDYDKATIAGRAALKGDS